MSLFIAATAFSLRYGKLNTNKEKEYENIL